MRMRTRRIRPNVAILSSFSLLLHSGQSIAILQLFSTQHGVSRDKLTQELLKITHKLRTDRNATDKLNISPELSYLVDYKRTDAQWQPEHSFRLNLRL